MVGSCRILTVPINPLLALSMVPTLGTPVMQIIGGVRSGLDVVDAIGLAFGAVDGDKFKTLVVQMLSGTSLVSPAIGKKDLISVKALEEALTAHPEQLIPMLLASWEVSFKRFFPGFGLIGLLIPTENLTPTSSPNTESTGQPTG